MNIGCKFPGIMTSSIYAILYLSRVNTQIIYIKSKRGTYVMTYLAEIRVSTSKSTHVDHNDILRKNVQTHSEKASKYTYICQNTQTSREVWKPRV